MTSVTFKLLPLPEKEVICCRRIPNVEKLTSALKQLQVMHRGALPAIMDVYRAEGQSGLGTLIVGFSGNRQSVEESSAAAIGAGLSFEMYNTWERHAAKPGLPELGYNRQFWADRSWREGTIESVRRSRLPALIERLPIGTPFVARLGQGTLYHSGHRMTESSARPRSLEMRMKQQFDPHGILPDLP
jgi:FAD/FMN-containing dehydrogenase